MGLFSKGGVFYVSLTIKGKRIQKSLHTKSQKLADELYSIFLKETFLQSPLMKLVAPRMAPKATSAPRRSMEFIKAFEAYIVFSQAEGQSKPTIEGKKFTLKLLARHGVNTFGDVNSSKLDKFWQFCKTKYKDESIKKFVGYLKGFLNWAVKKGCYKRDEYSMLVFPKLATKIREEVFSDADWKLIQNHLRGKDKEFLLYLDLLYHTGMRPAEGYGLLKQNIDFEKGVIKVYQNKTKRDKTVYLPAPMMEKLQDIDNAALFIRDERSKEFFSKKFSKLKAELGLNPLYTLYTFRHTFATRLLNKTGDIHLVSKALGHSNIQITSRHYANRTSKDIQDRVSVLWQDEP